MPVETFVAFVTEQALGIAVGVTAVVAAPKLVSRLAGATQNVQRFGAKVAAGPISGATNATGPVMAACRTVYDQVIGGMQWYGEQWADLTAEAKEMQAARTAGLRLTSYAANIGEDE